MGVVAALYLDDRDIGHAVGADKLSVVLAAVVEVNHYGACALYNVVAGNDVAVRGDYNAGAAARVHVGIPAGHGYVDAYHRVHTGGNYILLLAAYGRRAVVTAYIDDRRGSAAFGGSGLRRLRLLRIRGSGRFRRLSDRGLFAVRAAAAVLIALYGPHDTACNECEQECNYQNARYERAGRHTDPLFFHIHHPFFLRGAETPPLISHNCIIVKKSKKAMLY